MALAILEPIGFRGDAIEFLIDTGSNDHYELKIGKGVGRRDGIPWIDEVYLTAPLAAVPGRRDRLDSTARVRVPAGDLQRGPAYAQLFSFKGPQRRSPSYSDVVPLPVGTPLEGRFLMQRSTAITAMSPPLDFNGARQVACRTGEQELAHTASIADLIGQVVAVATPVVTRLLSGATNGARASANGGADGVGSAAGANLVANLLRTLLESLRGPADGQAAQQSLSVNRFSRPFVFGIDDALLGSLVGSLVGPIAKLLPQLANATNQERLKMRQANNQLVSGIISGISQRQMMREIIDALKDGEDHGDHERQGGEQSAELGRLLQLLQQAGGARVPAPSPTATTQSVRSPAEDAELSSRAALSFVHGAKVNWQDRNAILFAHSGPMQQRVRLDVAPPAPTTPLPRAICKLRLKDHRDQAVLHEQEYRLADVRAGTEIALDIDAETVSGLPVNRPIDVCAELRWPVGGGRVRRALGSTEIVMVDRWHVAGPGAPVSEDRELVDTNAYRAFWNKVWESPVLDAPAGGRRKLLWELDVMARYTVIPTADHDSNGVMETRTRETEETLDSVTERTKGRMKAGIELSISELAKLTSLWPDQAPIETEVLAAFNTPAFARGHISEFTRQLELKGKADQRGIVWVGPVLKLFEFPLASVAATAATGQVVEVTPGTARLPLPSAARIIGLVAGERTDAGPPENINGPGYAFEGYAIETFDKVALSPADAPARVAA